MEYNDSSEDSLLTQLKIALVFFSTQAAQLELKYMYYAQLQKTDVLLNKTQ